ncbi:MAG: hypothetical protein ACI9TH_000305 [Kiritimatiellia bacterium]|jgi:hypothetical protein
MPELEATTRGAFCLRLPPSLRKSVTRWLTVLGALLTLIGAVAAEDAIEYTADITADALLDMWLLPDAPIPAEPLPRWGREFRFNAGMGYKENVQFSAFNPRDSAFSLAEVEGYLYTLQPEKHESYVYAFADQRHYFDLDQGADEQSFIGQAAYKRHHDRYGSFGAELQTFYFDQFLDASFSELELNAIRLRQYEFGGLVSYGRPVGKRAKVEVAYGPFRSQLANAPDDYDRHLARLNTEYAFDRSTLKLELQQETFDYDQRARRQADGARLAGRTDIEADQARMTSTWYWDAQKAWHNRLQGTLRQLDDNGGGYYNYDSWQILYRLQHRRGPWTTQIAAQYRESDYDTHPSDLLNLQSSPLYRKAFRSHVRIEHAWENWMAFSETSWEDNDSNDPLDRYEQFTTLLGVGYTFN